MMNMKGMSLAAYVAQFETMTTSPIPNTSLPICKYLSDVSMACDNDGGR